MCTNGGRLFALKEAGPRVFNPHGWKARNPRLAGALGEHEGPMQQGQLAPHRGRLAPFAYALGRVGLKLRVVDFVRAPAPRTAVRARGKTGARCPTTCAH